MSKASERAYQHIRQAILRGDLPPGSRLKEEELAAQIGVSRTPIREGLRQLLAEGLADRPDGGATIIVAAFSTADLEDLFRLRAMLESHAAALAAERITDEQIGLLQSLVADMDAMISSGSKPAGYLDSNAAFHRCILEASGSRRLAMLMPHVVEAPFVARTFDAFDREALERSNAHHSEITRALAVRDGEWAAAVMRAHITNAWHSWRDRQTIAQG
jgi:DNA-binding GntR family transcriptional regulator